MCRFKNVLPIGLVCVAVTAGIIPRAEADFIAIDPKATYLRVNSDPGNLPAPAIDLSGLSFRIRPGDLIRLERVGDFFNGRDGGDTRTGMLGVFSSSSTLLGGANRFRVPDAIDAGEDWTTAPTYYGGLATDIPEDFLISGGPASGISSIVIQVPDGARFLFVAAADNLFGDNTDPNRNFGVLVTPVPEPAGLIGLATGLVITAIAGRRSYREGTRSHRKMRDL